MEISNKTMCECPECGEHVVVVSETADPADTRIEKLTEGSGDGADLDEE